MRLLASLFIAATIATAYPAVAGAENAACTAMPEFQVASLPLPPPPRRPVSGVASWYGGHHAGRPTASGEIHSIRLRTAAHRDLPLGTFVRVTNLKNGRATVVKVNDRGPYIPGRLIDLSERAARDLGMIDDGLAPVRIEVVSR